MEEELDESVIEDSIWERIKYFFLGTFIRIKACECASRALGGKLTNEGMSPLVWSVTVFFETYILTGSHGTRKEFGPSDPVKLEAIVKDKDAEK
jgi:hypothetical protein